MRRLAMHTSRLSKAVTNANIAPNPRSASEGMSAAPIPQAINAMPMIFAISSASNNVPKLITK